ncbi:hypothetical protein ASG31_17940 [Chryseobacterium sp. Leaf404]|uniref:addiction module protein n=1 Tax=unclassified Chryseobacterium TaxID=2593645 RepID=UPI0006FD5BB0|nr:MULTISPECIES: addiction module protein [unclassified Chryseobacterium]KQT19260.1 hypothetical protein ASG31_17940 [Chryseobacterium sp. Leaf404]
MQKETQLAFISIEEWQLLKEKYNDLEQLEPDAIDIPDWHKKILDERLEDYKKNPASNADFDTMLNEIRSKYGF